MKLPRVRLLRTGYGWACPPCKIKAGTPEDPFVNRHWARQHFKDHVGTTHHGSAPEDAGTYEIRWLGSPALNWWPLRSANRRRAGAAAHRVVTLCGSMRFFEQMLITAAELTADGVIVLAPFVALTGDEQRSVLKADLDALHFAKIDLAEEIFVVNVDGYIGDSTRREIMYAAKRGKKITYLEAQRVSFGDDLTDRTADGGEPSSERDPS